MALVEFQNNSAPYLNAENLNNNFEYLDENIAKKGKLLWSGNFTSGSITIDGLSNYTCIIVNVGGILCIGNKSYGIGGYVQYGGYTINLRGYRLTSSNDTLTINSTDFGGSDGTQQQPITAIYGLF